jgi:hypothetical protein
MRHVAIAGYARLRKSSKGRRSPPGRPGHDPRLDDWFLRTREATIDALATISHPASVSPCAASRHRSAAAVRGRRARPRIGSKHGANHRGENRRTADMQDLKRRIESWKELDRLRSPNAVPVDH